jgi:hypothetical protein
MSTLTQTLANEAVEAFLAELDPDLRERLGEPQTERLELLIQQAVSAGIHHAAEQAENLARGLRSEAGSTPLEL